MIEIVPAIIPKSLSDLTDHLERVKGLVPVVQVDIVDGKFVPSVGWPYTKGGEKEFQQIIKEEEGFPYWQELDIEVDLMVQNPEEVVEDWMHAGVTRIVVHIESTKNFNNIVRDLNAHVTRSEEDMINVVSLGIAFNTTTSIDTIEPYLSDVDFVQCMGIAKIGYQGQPFDERVLDQISELRERHPELIISVDGSVNLETAADLASAGASRLVSGSALFESEDIEATLEEFKMITE